MRTRHGDRDVVIREARGAIMSMTLRSITRMLSRERKPMMVGAILGVGAIMVLVVLVFGEGLVLPIRSSAQGVSTNGGRSQTCAHVHAHLVGADEFPGAAVSAGVLVVESVSASRRCTVGGYPMLGVVLDNGTTVHAAHVRAGIFGGAPSPHRRTPLPSITLGTRPSLVSFTLSWVTGNGGGSCPGVRGLRVELPGDPVSQSVASLNDGGAHPTTFLGIYCAFLTVTPIVRGTTGRLHFGVAPPAA